MQILVHITPSNGANLKTALENVRRLKAKTFSAQKRDKWVHEKHRGWIWIKKGEGGAVSARVCAKGDVDPKAILESFVGFVLRHVREDIATITISLN